MKVSYSAPLAGIFLSLCAAGAARAAPPHAERTLSIDSGLFPWVGTSRAFKNLWFEWDGLGGAAFDFVNDKTPIGSNPLTRALWAAGAGTGWYFADYTWYVSNHEFGHGTRIVSTGFMPSFTWDNGWAAHSEIYSFVFEGFGRFNDGAYTQVSGGNARAYPSNWGTVITSAGMNASQMFGETLEDEIGTGGGHLLQALSYYRAKTDAFFYALATKGGFDGDVSDNISAWASQGIAIPSSEIEIGGAVSLLASFSTYSYLWSILRYAATGDARTAAFYVGPLRLPDVSFYQNPGGLSYRLRTEVKARDFSIPISVEVLYHGNFTVEGSGGIRVIDRDRSFWLAKAYLNTQLGVGAELSKGIRLGKSFLAVLGGGVFTTQSLQGQRTLDYLVSSAFGVDAWGRLSYVF